MLESLGEEELTRMILELREPYRTPCRLVLLEQNTMAKTVEAQVYRGKKILAQQITRQNTGERGNVHGTV